MSATDDRIGALGERIDRIEDILARLEVRLHYALRTGRNDYARPGMHAGSRYDHPSPFEGIQHFPANIIAAVEERFKDGSVEDRWCEQCGKTVTHTYSAGTLVVQGRWRCLRPNHPP